MILSDNDKGFTFIELLFVAIFVGLLAAVALPGYKDYLIRSQITESFLLTFNLKTAISDYYGTHGRLPPNNEAVGAVRPEKIMSNYISSVEVVNGQLYVTFGNICDASISGEVLTFRPQIHNTVLGTLSWHCGGDKETTVPTKYLPAVCKRTSSTPN